MNPRSIILTLLCLTAFLGLPACDGNASNEKSINEEIEEINRASREEQRRQIEEEGVADVGTEHLDQMGSALENAAANASGEQAKVLREQASLVREMQANLDKYDAILNELIAAGGIDASTVTGPEDIENRLEIVDRLEAENERLAIEQPRILRRMGEIENTSSLIEKQLVYHRKIRQTDRDLFAAMRGVFGILSEYGDGIEVLSDGSIMFDEDMPDEVLNQYNAYIEEINLVSAQQGQLQLELLELVP